MKKNSITVYCQYCGNELFDLKYYPTKKVISEHGDFYQQYMSCPSCHAIYSTEVLLTDFQPFNPLPLTDPYIQKRIIELKSYSLEQNEQQFKPIKTSTTQQEREQVLIQLLDELQAKQPALNPQSLPYYREDMWKMLADKSELFEGISNSTFEKFFKAQKLCKSGLRRPKIN